MGWLWVVGCCSVWWGGGGGAWGSVGRCGWGVGVGLMVFLLGCWVLGCDGRVWCAVCVRVCAGAGDEQAKFVVRELSSKQQVQWL